MPKARSSDRSLASLSRPRCPRPPLPFSSRVPVAFGTPDFGVATERGAPATERSTSASERTRVDRRPGVWDAKGVRLPGVDTLLGISTYDCPGGVHRSAKQSSPGLDPSRALRALFSTPRKGVTYRDTRESTEGLDISRWSAAVVAAWFRARFTAQKRTTYGIPVEVRWLSLLLFLSLSLLLAHHVVYMSTLFISPILNDLLLLPAKRISRRREFTAREIWTLVHLRTVLPITR